MDINLNHSQGYITISTNHNNWSRISVTTKYGVRSYGCDSHNIIVNKILNNLSNSANLNTIMINNVPYFNLISLCDPHCSIYMTLSLDKIIFIPDSEINPKIMNVYKSNDIQYIDFDKFSDTDKTLPQIIMLKENQYKEWIEMLDKERKNKF